MHTRRSLLIALPVLAVGASKALGQGHATIAGFDEADRDLAYSLVRDITTWFGPRPAGSAAEAAAAQWGSEKLKQLGFHNVTIERFPLLRWSPGNSRVELLGDVSQRLVATSLGGVVPGPPVQAPVTLFKSYKDFLRSEPEAVRGRIVGILEPVQRASDGSGYIAVAPARALGPREAMARGAAGFIIRSLGTHEDNVANSGSTAILPREFPAFALSPAAADQVLRAAEIGEARLHLESTAGWLGTSTSQNVAATVPGSDPDAPPIIIGAHIDSWEQGTGAIDDAFGIAVVTAAAARILHSGRQPRHPIKLVWFGAEEVSQPGPDRDFVGARAFTRTHLSEVKRAMVVAESDWGGGRITSITMPPATRKDVADKLRDDLRPLGISAQVGPLGPGVAEIGVLAAAGAPLLRLHQDATALFDIHHTPNDVLSRVDPTSLEQNVTVWERVLSAFAFAR